MKRLPALLLLVLILASPLFAAESTVTAVSPFENLSADNELNYIGFQISEYLSTAMASIEGVTMVERGMLEKIVKEQSLQLSGLTKDSTAIEVGNLLNARRIITGSYSVSGTTIDINGRIIDVESGKVLNAARVSGYFSDNLSPVLYDFFFALLDQQPPEQVFSQMSVLEQRIAQLEADRNGDMETELAELKTRLEALENREVSLESTISDLKVSLAVEARLSMLQDQDAEAGVSMAKAMEASFSNNDTEALEYLETAVADPTANYLNYSLSADSYFEKLSAVEGQSFYVTMIRNQLDINKTLSEDAEAISLYRNTLKILVSRLYGALSPDMFTLEVGTPESVEMGTVSALVTLPSDISIEVNNGTRRLVDRVFDTQDILDMTERKYYEGGMVSRVAHTVAYKKQPPVLESLLPCRGMDSLFSLGLFAGIGYSVQFVDRQGNVLYELGHPGETFFNLTAGSEILWGRKTAEAYSEKEARDGWSFRDGKVEIQARELKNLHGVKVVLDRSSFSMGYSFPVYGDTKWKSILMHAYRQKYIKITTDGESDPMPQVKDVVVTHSLFDMADYMQDIPLLIDPDYISASADLTAVVYWGDSSNTVVTGAWKGVKEFECENYGGEFTPDSVLYFPMEAVMEAGEGTFTVGNNGSSRETAFRVIAGNTWINPDGANFLTVHDNRVYTSYASWNSEYCTTRRLDAETGKELWKTGDAGRAEMLVSDGILYSTYYYRNRGRTTAHDALSGELVWSARVNSHNLHIVGNRIYTVYDYEGACLDPADGSLLWQSSDVRGRNLVVAGGKIYTIFSMNRSGWVSCVDAQTGEPVWKNDRISGSGIAMHKGRLFIVSGSYAACLDPSDGSVIWKNTDVSGSDLAISGDLLYTTGKTVTCLDPVNGRLVWQNQHVSGDTFQVIGDRLYVGGEGNTMCLGTDSGSLHWLNSEADANDMEVIHGSVFIAGNDTLRLDIRCLEPWCRYTSEADSFYDRDEYPRAADLYGKAITAEGCRDGVVLYRYAYSLEQDEGLSLRVKNLYLQAWVRLKEQYPGHRYITAAEEKLEA